MKKVTKFLLLLPVTFHRLAKLLPGKGIPAGGVQFANIGEGTVKYGMKSYLPDATTSQRYLLYKIGTDGDHVAVCGAGEVPIGPSDDQADSTTTPIAVKILGGVTGLVRGVTDGTIANGDHVKAGASGVIVKASTTDVSFGIALFGTDTSSASGDVITYVPCVPHKHVF